MPRTGRAPGAARLPDGEARAVHVDGLDVLLYRRGGRLFAVGGRCTHQGAPLGEGAFDGDRVVCPWHHAAFSLCTGGCLQPPALDALPCYAVEEDGEDVLVTFPDDARDTEVGAPYRESAGVPPDTATYSPAADTRVFVVVGAGAAGHAAAETLRQEGYRGRLVLVSAEEHLPYDRTHLSKGFLAGDRGDEALPIRSRSWYETLGAELWLGRRVEQLDAVARRLTFTDGETLRYHAALLAPGAEPVPLKVPGADLNGVHYLRSAADAHRLVGAAKGARRAVVVGTGFIGMEAAASLRARGLDVTVVGRGEEPLGRVLGAEVGRALRRLHEERGVHFRLSHEVAAVEADGGALAVVLDTGDRLSADLVLIGLGVAPATGFVAGVERAEDGGVVVDQSLRAADALWAAGDVAQFPLQDGRRVRVEHWRVAQQHGRTAARAMLGLGAEYRDVPFFWSDQYGTGLHYAGYAEDASQPVIEGDLDGLDFIAYYLDGDRVVAAAGVGRDAEFARLHVRMEQGTAPDAEEVRRLAGK